MSRQTDASGGRRALARGMTQPIDLERYESGHQGRAKRLVAAIVATLVILAVLCFVELLALAFLAIASSAMNHHGLGS